MIKEKNSINFLIMNLLLTIYGIEVVYPPVTAIFNTNLICAFCLFGWLAVSFITDSDFYLQQDFRNVYPLIFYLATIVIPYMFGVGVIGNRYLSLGLIPLGYMIFNYYKQKERLCDLKRISVIMAFFAAITFFKTLKALIENPYISRSIKSSGEHSETLARQGIGGYAFIYFIVIASIFLLYFSLKSKSRLFRLIAVITYLMTLILILKSSYMTALLTVIIASAVLLLSHYANSNSTNIIILSVLVITIFFFLINVDVIINKYSDIIPQRIASIVVSENGKSIYQSILDEFMNDRWPTMLESVGMFLKYPFFGIIGTGNIRFAESGLLTGFGQHSHILDTFALYGFLIGIVNIFIIFKPFKDQNGNRIKYGKALNRAMLVCTVGIYLFNNATPSTAFALGIMFPLIREIYDSENGI